MRWLKRDRPPGLLGWAFRPPNFMKKPLGRPWLRSEPRPLGNDPGSGFSPLSVQFIPPRQAGRVVPLGILSLILLSFFGTHALAAPWGGEMRFCIRNEPRSLHPALVDSDSEETIRYLTGGVLVRVNRSNQQLEPELATSWKIENGGKTIVFHLRQGIYFSDGTPFSAEDVAYTMQVLLDPALHSATGDSFRAGSGTVKTVQR